MWRYIHLCLVKIPYSNSNWVPTGFKGVFFEGNPEVNAVISVPVRARARESNRETGRGRPKGTEARGNCHPRTKAASTE
jgi:hypothetical protein